MPPAETNADRNQPEIVDLTETNVSSQDAAQVKGGGELTRLSPIEEVSSARVPLKTVVNGTVQTDGTSATFGNENFDVGGGSGG